MDGSYGVSTNIAVRSRFDFGSGGSQERDMVHGADEAALDTTWLPASRSGAPTAIVLHGGRGLFGDGDAVLPARSLVASGLNVLLVQGLGGRTIDADGRRRPKDPRRSRGRVDGLLDRFVDRMDDRRAPAFGVVGISYGATVALELGAADIRVRAVVSCFAPLYPHTVAPAANAPPALILHGRADATVPIGQAAELEVRLRASGAAVERIGYDGEGHGFTGPAQLDAVRRIAGFLRLHLAAR